MTAHGLDVVEEGPAGAPVVVLVHGSMDRMAGFAKVARRLADEYRVVRYDRRGYGGSAQHSGPFAVTDHAEDLLEVIAERQVILIGHSMGGNVVFNVAQRRPDIVRAAAIYETPLTWTPEWPQNSTSRTVGNDGADLGDVAEAFMRGMLGDERWERLPATTREARRGEGRVLVGEMSSVRELAPWDPSAITVPAVIGRGSKARPHHFAGMERLARALPDATLVTLEGCHHAAHTASADQFTEEFVRPAINRAR